MRSYRWEGTATAVSSLVHGGDTLGTITYLRRESFLTPSGRQDVPVVSGNAVRGVLRDIGAKLLWSRLGEPRLPLPVTHALWAGGALVKAKGQPLTGQRLADLRRMVAHVGVFGAAGGGRIIDGALTVGKLVPVCSQTAHVLPADLAAGPLPDLHDLLQIEQYTRFPDGDRLTHVLEAPPEDPTADDDAGLDLADGLMRYGVESFVAGTRFHCFFALSNATDAEHDFFTDVLDRFLADPVVGGKVGRGHGRLSLDLDARDLDAAPAADPASSNAASGTRRWTDLGGATVEDVLTALRWLD